MRKPHMRKIWQVSLGNYCENRTFLWKSHKKCAIFTKMCDFHENRTFWKSHNLKISQFEKITFWLLKDCNNWFKDLSDIWYFIEISFKDFLKRDIFSKISKLGFKEIFETFPLRNLWNLFLQNIKYHLNELFQSFNNKKVIFSKCEIFKLWDFQNVRFSKCAIFTKIAHFDENRTKNVRFSQKCAIFTIIL